MLSADPVPVVGSVPLLESPLGSTVVSTVVGVVGSGVVVNVLLALDVGPPELPGSVASVPLLVPGPTNAGLRSLHPVLASSTTTTANQLDETRSTFAR